MDSAGRLQVVEETLSSQLPDLRRGLLSSRHHRPCSVASEWREAGEDGLGAGDTEAGAPTAGASTAYARGGTKPAAP